MADTDRARRARERAQERRRALAIEQHKQARRRLLFRVLVPVVLVVVVVAVLVVVRVTTGGGSDTRTGVVATGPAPASLVTAITTVSAADFDRIGAGSDVRSPSPIDGQALTADGKPRILYVGGEFCPFCAAERWPVVVALSRFGTFTGLQQTNSSSDDVHPDTATLSFSGSTYTSDVLAFSGYETSDREGKPLDTLPDADTQVVQQLDPRGSIPFQDLGGKFVVSGATYDPDLLADKTHAEIAQAIADPTTDIGKAVLASANRYTAALCTLTGGKPGSVCDSAGVKAAAGTLSSS